MGPSFWRKSYLAVATAIGVLSFDASANAILVAIPHEEFVFTGACDDCVGYGVGELYLLSSFVPGNSIAPDFVSWSYTSSLLSYILTSPDYVAGAIPTNLPSTAGIEIVGGGYRFMSRDDEILVRECAESRPTSDTTAHGPRPPSLRRLQCSDRRWPVSASPAAAVGAEHNPAVPRHGLSNTSSPKASNALKQWNAGVTRST